MAQKFIGVILPMRMGQTGMFDQSISVIDQTRSNFNNLILTKKGERVSHPTFGCDLWKVLFDQLDDEFEERAKIVIEQAVEEWLGFLEVVQVTVVKSPDNNRFAINCLYRFRSNPNVVQEATFIAEELGRISAAVTGSIVPDLTEAQFRSGLPGSRADRLARIQEAQRIRRTSPYGI